MFGIQKDMLFLKSNWARQEKKGFGQGNKYGQQSGLQYYWAKIPNIKHYQLGY